MKKILFILIHTYLFAVVPNQGLLDYQQRYTLCHGKSNYQISKCLLNGNINYARFRGDRFTHRKISKKDFREVEHNGNIYEYVINKLSNTRRYIWLKNYLDYLYSIQAFYIPPQFKGDDAEDITRIKKIFNLLQDSDFEVTPYYTQSFEAELLVYQERHGLTADGDIGPQTKRELKQSIQSIILKVKKNLELERISSLKGSNYVLVNIPEFKMYYYDNNEPVLNMKVIVGKTRMRTPIFNRNMKYIVKNPRWNVPDKIYKNEYAHKSEEYLRKKGFAYNKEGKLYQRSGKRNALGVVKFLFPNKYNVYMHDTPAKSLFNKRVRAFSHGCIRLENPLGLLTAIGYAYTNRRN